MPVLYGVLMYMGVASLKGMQFVDRIGLLFMPPKYQPDYSYLRHVPIKKVHLFTFIQASIQRPLRSLNNLEELIFYRYWHWQSYGFWKVQTHPWFFLWWFWPWFCSAKSWITFPKYSVSRIYFGWTTWCHPAATKKMKKLNKNLLKRTRMWENGSLHFPNYGKWRMN